MPLIVLRNNARCTQARKATHGLSGQYQDVDRTPRGRVNQNGLRNSLGCFSHVKNIDLHYITLHYITSGRHENSSVKVM